MRSVGFLSAFQTSEIRPGSWFWSRIWATWNALTMAALTGGLVCVLTNQAPAEQEPIKDHAGPLPAAGAVADSPAARTGEEGMTCR